MENTKCSLSNRHSSPVHFFQKTPVYPIYDLSLPREMTLVYLAGIRFTHYYIMYYYIIIHFLFSQGEIRGKGDRGIRGPGWRRSGGHVIRLVGAG